jgi:Holliday junction resolvase RusA-like endonuclease
MMHAHGLAPLECPIALTLEFFTMRPKGHFRRRRDGCPELRANAPVRPTSAPDGDKLWRSVGDALNGVCYRDDRQVCEATVRKRYTSASQPLTGVRVTVSAFTGDP